MKVLIAGAGPAGLSFAALLAQSHPTAQITVWERTAADRSPGWGITLRSHALSFLDLDKRIAAEFLDGRTLRYRGTVAVDLASPEGVRLATFPRRDLIRALADRCLDLGVRLSYSSDAGRAGDFELDDNDLVVAADGAHSTLRARYAQAFRPSISPGRNRYMWLGAAVPFHRLTIALHDQELPMLAWAYKYTARLSTFIVECAENAYERLVRTCASPQVVCATMQNIFSAELQGNSILVAGSAHWQPFEVVSCERLSFRHIVLLGDAAHTTHFSQGFGTMFAFDDAITLHSALQAYRNIPDALLQYEQIQQPKIHEFQATAAASMRWSEDLLEAAEQRDDLRIRDLIAARWKNNAVTHSPMEQFAGKGAS